MSGSPGIGALAETAAPSAPKRLSGWKQLRKLLPYLSRCKAQVVVGMIALAAMGIVGTLQPLAFGVIMDCLAGNAQPLGRWQTLPALQAVVLVRQLGPPQPLGSVSSWFWTPSVQVGAEHLPSEPHTPLAQSTLLMHPNPVPHLSQVLPVPPQSMPLSPWF